MKIALGSDHAGYAYKEAIKAMLLAEGHEVKDCGTSSTDMVDYPLTVRPAATPGPTTINGTRISVSIGVILPGRREYSPM